MGKYEDKHRLRDTTAGYYSYVEGARYISPLFTGALFPNLVELHESQHEYLAHANATDSVARLFAGVLQWGEGQLLKAHADSIQELFGVINENTVYTQELIATYTSFILFAHTNPGDIRQARKQLPEFYEGVLRAGETSFGPIGDPRFKPGYFTIILACAIAAMNIPFPIEIVKFDRIHECISFVKANSPDLRFKSILERVSPPWEPASVIAGIDGSGDDPDHTQAETFRRLRETFPRLHFFSYHERPTLFRDWAATLTQDARQYGYTFLEGRQVQSHPEDSAVERMGVQFELPGLGPDEPLDLSLVTTGYATGSLEEFEYMAILCSREKRCLFSHVFVLPEAEGEAHVICFASTWQSEPTPVTPFAMACDFAELLRALGGLPHGSVVLKIDERWGVNAAGKLGKTGHPVFRLAHDTRPKNLIKLISQAAADQQVSLSRIKIQSEEFSIMVIKLHRDNYSLLAPVTRLGVDLISREFAEASNVQSPPTQEEVFTSLAIDRSHFGELIATCYISGTSTPQKTLKPSKSWWKFW